MSADRLPPDFADRLPPDMTEETETAPRREDTRRSLLAKAGVAAGGAGLAALARAHSAPAHPLVTSRRERTFAGFNNVKDPPPGLAENAPGHDGAKGNGRSDDTAAIQAWINASSAGGSKPGAVYFPPGIYICNSKLKLPSHTTLVGVPSRSMIKAGPRLPKGPQTDPLLETRSLSAGTNAFAQADIHIEGIVFNGNKARRPLTNWHSRQFLVRLYSVQTLRIVNCEFRNYGYGFLALAGCKDVALSGLRFRDWGWAGPPSDPITDAGPALWIAGNPITSPRRDETPSSRIRACDLDFENGEWSAILLFARDFVLESITIRDAKEAGIYTHGQNWTGTGWPQYHQSTRNGIISGLIVKGIRRRNISACGFEGGGHDVALRNFLISDTDGPGVQVNWPAENFTVEDGQTYDAVKERKGYPIFAEYGHVTLIRRRGSTGKQMRNAAVRHVTCGKPGLTPEAKHGIRVIALGPESYENLQLIDNQLRHGYRSPPASPAGQPISFKGAAVIADNDPLSRIVGNVGHLSHRTHRERRRLMLRAVPFTVFVRTGFIPSIVRIATILDSPAKVAHCKGVHQRGDAIAEQSCQMACVDAVGQSSHSVLGSIIRLRDSRGRDKVAARLVATRQDGFRLKVWRADTDWIAGHAVWLDIEAEP